MADPVDSISFTLNDEQVQLNNVSPQLTLLEWLRAQPGLTGTKKMCGEGGCGCCVVSVTRKGTRGSDDDTIAINSCLCPLYSVDGWSIKTVEGIGSSKRGFHPIQKAVARYNGTQCGYCTPGFVMSMYSLNNSKKCSLQEVEDNFDGNICRCTGYRPILDAMKSMCDDEPISSKRGRGDAPDLEDLCPKLCSSCPTKTNYWVTPTRNHGDPTWYTPTTISGVFDLFRHFKNKMVKLICGNTGKGIFKNEGKVDAYINIKNIPDLNTIKCSDDGIVVGGCVSITNLIQILMKLKNKSNNFTYLANHLKKVANVPVRNIGSWAGNLMLTHDNKNFPSDVFTMMAAVGAKVTIASDSNSSNNYSLFDFLKLDMKGMLIVSLTVPYCTESSWFRSYKISPRTQNAHAYVNAAFQMEVDPTDNKVKGVPSFVYGGLQEHSVRVGQTESFMVGKDLNNIETLQGVLKLLSEEIDPKSTPVSSSIEYRKQLALNLFYKFYLSVVGDSVSPLFQSAPIEYVRPISKGSQDFETHQTQYPLTQPMPKLTAALQASGEAQYTSDIPKQEGELAAVFVLSAQANAEIIEIDSSVAMTISGAIRVITAKDIPGSNDYRGNPTNTMPILADKFAEHAGEPVAMAIADSEAHAQEMARAVIVKYKSRGKPILSIKEAIERESYHDLSGLDPVNIGNIKDALSNSEHVISGEIHCPSQYHFHMETHVSLVVPDDDGYTVHSSTQSLGGAQRAVANCLGIDNNRVNVSVKRVGGAYGAKLFKAAHVAAACSLGAYFTNRPVRMHMDLETNMKCMGKRFPYYAKYTVGSTKEGILNGMKIDVYTDEGCYRGENAIEEALFDFDNVYKCPNWLVIPRACKTHTPSNTYCRAPGFLPVLFITESIMDHLAKTLDQDPNHVKELNMYSDKDTSYVADPKGMPLTYCNIKQLWNDVLESAEVEKRQKLVEAFNKTNRWRKRGLAMVPSRYGIMWTGVTTTVLVSVYKSDGTVAITHGGVEMGQGVNTKVAQTAATALGVDIRKIIIKPSTTMTNPNGSVSGGSVTSDMNCKALLNACKPLKERLDTAKESLLKENVDSTTVPTWLDIVKQAAKSGMDLSSKGFIHGTSEYMYDYNVYGVSCAEVEVDVLTGQREILRVDILNDCGESMNPEIDVGQIEGSYVMGLGYWLTEKLKYDEDSGQLLTHNTWEYKPPFSKDIPQDFRVSLVKNMQNPRSTLRSKGVGEPPMVLSCAVLFALKRAIESARCDSGNSDPIVLSAPLTVEDTQKLCLTDPSQFGLSA